MTRSSGSGVDLALTRLMKFAGIGLAVYNGVTTRDAATFGVASFMMMGGQGLENIIANRAPARVPQEESR